jgi:AraC-like DNA-binding protein
MVVDHSDDIVRVGIRVKPWAGGAFWRMPPQEFLDQEIDATECCDLIAVRIDRLFCEMSRSKYVTDIANIVMKSMLAIFEETELDASFFRARSAIASLAASHGTTAISSLSAELKFNERTMNRDCIKLSGLSPKVHARIFRFRRAVDLLKMANKIDLCHIAADCGYADQAHMTREFSSFAGTTPASFANTRRAHTGHYI